MERDVSQGIQDLAVDTPVIDDVPMVFKSRRGPARRERHLDGEDRPLART